MVRSRRRWVPAPLRPVVPNGYERQFVYEYGAVSMSRKDPRENGEFLPQVRQTHPADLIVMAPDGARSHKAQDLTVPAHVRLLALPADAP